MGTYDFRRLSYLDFEELAHDLLQALWKQSLEAFKTGADQGIDLRHTSAGGGTTIVQCKHYEGSGFSKLRAVLKDEELPKVRKLAPQRYVLVTSVPLSPDQKDTLKTDLAPFVLNTGDIVGQNDVDALLRSNPEVVKTHHKLWLTSTPVLERVLHAAEACKTEFELEKITSKLPLYVQSSAYPNALKILQEEQIVIISGEPGIGKTTLAEMLIYAHLADGFVPAAIESEIREGRKAFSKGRKSIFYFDDFLGQTYLGDRPDYTGRNQDLALVEFMEMVRASDSRFILTTREHILSGALRHSERLFQSEFVAHRCVLELSDYTREQRARILYNHLAFSKISTDHREELLRDSFFLNIIDHQHFNPRIIDWITSEPRLKGVDVGSYQTHVRKILDDPSVIWRHAFENQISPASRYVLIALHTSGPSVSLQELQLAWTSLYDHAARKYNLSRRPNEFRDAVKELTGGFIKFAGQDVTLLNPSVRDYLSSVLASSKDYVLDVAGSFARIRQIASLYKLGVTKNYQVNKWIFEDAQGLAARIAPLLTMDYHRFHRRPNGLISEWFELHIREQVQLIANLADSTENAAFVSLLSEAVDTALGRWDRWGPDIPVAMTLMEYIADTGWLLANGGQAQIDRLENAVIDRLDDGGAEDWLAVLDGQSKTVLASATAKAAVEDGFQRYRQHGVQQEEDACSDASDYASLAEHLETLGSRHNIDFTDRIEGLQELAAERERGDDEYQGVGSTSPNFPRSAPAAPSATDDQLRQMFKSFG